MNARGRKALEWLLLLPAVLPLIYADGMLYPYMAPKTLLLRGLGIVTAALFAYLVCSGEPFYWSRLKGKMSWIPGALLVVAYATSVFGVDFSVSFWSTFSRGDGLLSLTVIVGYFYFIILGGDATFLRKLYTAVAWVGSLVAVHALLQWAEALGNFSIPLISQTGDRLGGTLGNAEFLASYLALSLFATLLTAHASSKRYQTALYIGAALQLLVIILTATRGSILALGLAVIAVFIYISIRGEGRIKVFARGGLAAVIIVAGLFVAFRSTLSQSSFIPVARIASISLNDTTVSSRLFLWKNLTAAALPHALTGVGAEHVSVLFDRVYNPDLIYEQWFDRSHDSFVDYFVQFGIVGLLLYLALVASSGYVGWKLFSAKGSEALPGLTLLLITGVYTIQNIFVFDTSSVLWFFVALFSAALVVRSSDTPSALKIQKGEWIGIVPGLAIALCLIPVSIQPLRANLYLADAYIYHVADISRSVDSLQKGFALNTYANVEYGYEVYQMFTGEQLAKLSGANLVIAYQETERILEQNFKRYPYDVQTAADFAHVLDLVPPGAPAPAGGLQQRVLDEAIALSPDRSQLWYLKANIFIEQTGGATSTNAKMKLYAKAIDVLKEYAARVPALDEPRYAIAMLYLNMGDKTSAKQWADEGLALYKKNGDTAGYAVKYYLAVEDWPHAEKYLQDIVDEYPTDYGSVYDLAKASYLAGDKEKALSLVAQLRKEDPGYVESDPAFLSALGQ